MASDSLDVSWRWREGGQRERGRRRVFRARAGRCSLPRELKTLLWLSGVVARTISSLCCVFCVLCRLRSEKVSSRGVARPQGRLHAEELEKAIHVRNPPSSSPTRRHRQQRRRRRPQHSGICFVLHSRLPLYLMASYSAYSPQFHPTSSPVLRGPSCFPSPSPHTFHPPSGIARAY